MKNTMKAAVLTFTACSLIAGVALKATAADTKAQAGEKCKLTAADQNFLKQMAQIDMLEQKLGELADQKGEAKAVKDFGARMKQDHHLNEDQLKTVAQTNNVPLPADLDASGKATYLKLSKLTGTAFDKEYMKAMVSGHKKALVIAKTADKNIKCPPDVKDYANKSAAAINEHLKLAEQTDKQIASEKTTRATTGSTKSGSHL